MVPGSARLQHIHTSHHLIERAEAHLRHVTADLLGDEEKEIDGVLRRALEPGAQDRVLRARFQGTPENAINFFFFIAEQVRRYMAQMGFRTFDEMVGRVDMLEARTARDHWKAKGIDLSAILYNRQTPSRIARRCVQAQDHGLSAALDYKLIEHAAEALESGTPIEIKLPIRNIHRTVGAMLSGEIARRYGSAGLPDNTIKFQFTGSAGQSFGAFLAKGVTLELEGDANDYVGKGLSGGRIIIYRSEE